jgi:hypothetical protein
MAKKQPEIKVQAEIGKILRGTGISNQLAEPYCASKTISKPNRGGLS